MLQSVGENDEVSIESVDDQQYTSTMGKMKVEDSSAAIFTSQGESVIA